MERLARNMDTNKGKKITDMSKDDNIAIKLDSDRRREIENVKRDFEEFYRQEIQFQAEMKSDMAVVKEQQKGLKERFEEGVSKRLAMLDGKFDKFLIEFGQKQEQDKSRDTQIKETRDNLNWLIRSLIISVAGGLILAGILYGLQFLKG